MSGAPATHPARRIAVTLAVILIAVSACRGAVATAQASDTVERSLSTTATQIEVEMFDGAIEVQAGPAGSVSAVVTRTGAGGSEAEALADAQKIDVTLEEEDGKVVLRATYTPDPEDHGRRGASAVVAVPSASVLVLRTSNGPIDASGLVGTIVAQTSDARITIDGRMQALRAKTSNGAVSITDGAGLIAVGTSNGRIDIVASDATVQAETSNGRIAFAGSLGAGTTRMHSSNGPIDVVLPGGAAFTVDAQTSNARIDSGFTVTGGSIATDRLTGTVAGGGDTTLILETSNAPVTIMAGS